MVSSAACPRLCAVVTFQRPAEDLLGLGLVKVAAPVSPAGALYLGVTITSPAKGVRPSPASACIASACSACCLASSFSSASACLARSAACAASRALAVSSRAVSVNCCSLSANSRAVSTNWRCSSAAASALTVSALAMAALASSYAFFGFSVERRGLGRVHPLLESFFFGFGKSVSPTTAGARRERKDQTKYHHQTNHTYLLVAASCLGRMTKHYLVFKIGCLQVSRR